jgi:hypothetical protein
MGYKIAINTMELSGKLPQGDPRWGKFNDAFVNKEIETIDFANDIYMGRAFAPWHHGRRGIDNFQLAQHIGVDMDTEDERSSIDAIKRMEFVAVYGGLIYTTPNHTPEKPRARIVFFLDNPITDREAYKAAIAFVYSLFPDPDTSCVDCSRFFYGSRNCQIEWLDNVLPLDHLRSYYKRYGQAKIAAHQNETPIAPQQAVAQGKRERSETGIITPDTLLNYAIGDSTGEGRNKRGYRLARQLRDIGLTQFEAEGYMRRYQSSVATSKKDPYTEREALITLRSAYTRPTKAAH